MHILGVNVFAILVAALATMALGFLWYSPLLFAKPWMAAMGYDKLDKDALEAMRKKAGPLYGLAMIASLISALGLGHLLWGHMHDQSAFMGFHVGLFIWFAFVMTVQLTDTGFSGKPWRLFFINTGYQLVCYLAMGTILAVWQ